MTIDADRAAEAFAAATDFTVGLEEEFALLGTDTLDLVPRFEELRDTAAATDPVLSDAIAGELISSEIEIRSGRGEREQAVAGVALAAQRVVEVLAAPRADLDLARDELAGDGHGEHRVFGGREVAQLLEARDEVQRRRVEDGELLLEADGGVGRDGEELLRCGQVDAHGLRSGRSRARRGGRPRGSRCGR